MTYSEAESAFERLFNHEMDDAQIPATKSTPKSKQDEYVKELA